MDPSGTCSTASDTEMSIDVGPDARSGCCVDCGSGKVACDEGCIRKLAAIECRSACRSRRDHPTDSCCAPGTVKKPSDTKAPDGSINTGKAECCTASHDGCRSGDCDDKVSNDCCTKREDARCVGETPSVVSLGRNKGKDTVASSTSTDQPDSMMEGCPNHLQKAFDEFARFLEEGRCICRSVLDRLDTGCGKPVTETAAARSSCTSGTSSSVAGPEEATRRRPAKITCEKSCCPKPVPLLESATTSEPLNANSDPITGIKSVPLKAIPTRAQELDVEESAAREHVLLNVTGMTCTGCSKKLTKAVHNVDGVHSGRVTFVTGLLEFDLDVSTADVDQVIARLQRETGFKFSRIVSNQQTLDVIIDPDHVRTVREKLQKQVGSIESLGKCVYRITFDPALIGARSLLLSARGLKLAPPGNDASLSEGKRRLRKMAWVTAVSALLTIPIVVLAWSDSPVPYSTRSLVSLVLATVVQAIAIPEFYMGAIKALIYSKIIEMDMLVVISITAAYGYSLVAFVLTHAGHHLQTGEFFETSSLLITLVLLGRFIAAVAKVKAITAVSTRSLQAEKALLLEISGSTTEIDARLLQFGDVFVVHPHARIVTDGTITDGRSAVDESMITGESSPVAKTVGNEVIAGTINGPSILTVSMTRLPGKNSITDIANLVDNALAVKPRIQDIADKVAGYFIPVVVTIALIVFGTWMGVATSIRHEGGGAAVGLAITYAISVLAISCPCALGLAVPMVLVIAGGVAARKGIIIKNADAIEKGHKVTDVVFDKTGTLTDGNLSIVHEQVFPQDDLSRDEIFSLAKSLTEGNQHPVSLAIAAHLTSNQADPAKLSHLESIPGSGIQATYRSLPIKAGNPHWLSISQLPQITTLTNRGLTLFCMTLASEPLAIFGLQSTIRPCAPSLIHTLHTQHITCHILSGDNASSVSAVATTLNIPSSHTASQQTPAMKQAYIANLTTQSKRTVLFIGDGTNDAPAIATASIGISFSPSTSHSSTSKTSPSPISHLTQSTADVIILSSLSSLLTFLSLSRQCHHRIIFNFVWSGIYNVVAILLAGGAFVKVRIPPAYAGLGEIVSVLPVVIAAGTLARGGRT